MAFNYKSTTVAFLLFINIILTKQDENNCDFSLKKQILTCENVNLKTANIENLITNTTQMLVIKNCENLTIGPGFHTTPFEVLTSYQLIGNKHLALYAYTFQKLTNIKYIKIMDNDCPILPSNTFYGLSQLELLNLNNNNIQTIENEAFNTLTALQTLELTNNNIKTINSFVFSSLRNLKSLFLYHCNMEVLEDDCFAGLNNLNVLDLTYNRLTHIKTEMFNSRPLLSHLYLSFNLIECIEGDFKAPKLEFLYLQNNRIKEISNSNFNYLYNLIDLDISKNKINQFPATALQNCTKLTNLNYKENNLNGTVDFVFNGQKPFITA